MFSGTFSIPCRATALLIALPTLLFAQQPPYDVFPNADPPYYRVRYEASTEPGELIFPVNYTLWVPPNAPTLRGVIVHQHGCGEGSCRSGLTGAYDLHWQALAKKHDCALLAPSYEQPEGADCQMWCDPRNGSAAAFQKCLVDLGEKCGHPELAQAPWALWGHSGGGHWAGGMVLLYPQRVAAAWLRSGVPLLSPNPQRSQIKAHELPAAALRVPVMCNPGTKEGVTVKDGRFAGVWPANEAFFLGLRGQGGLVGVAVDPLTAHECGNQRYLAIPWLDACLSARLPEVSGDPLRPMPTDDAWLASPTGSEAVPAAKFDGDALKAAWLPNEALARSWMQYVQDTKVTDATPPPAPAALQFQGKELSWEAEADLQSGLAGFLIERDGELLTSAPTPGKNPFGRPIYQGLQYSDTPTQPLVPMRFTDTQAQPGEKHTYRVIAVNTVGLKSNPAPASAESSPHDSEATTVALTTQQERQPTPRQLAATALRERTVETPSFPSSDWPWWRGASLGGHADPDQSPPLSWGREKGVLWRQAIPGRGHGSPIVVGDAIYLPTADRARNLQSVLCLDRQTGALRWETVVHRDGLMHKNEKASQASSTIACDGQRLLVNFLNDGAVYTSAISLSGELLWQTKISDYVLHQGYGSSPVVYRHLVIVAADNKGGGAVVGLDRQTGREVWRVTRPKTPNYPSPIVVHVAGKDQVIMTGCDLVCGIDPLTGEKLWEIKGATTECVTSTVAYGDLIYTSGGYPRNHVSAVRADGSGKVAWENKDRVYVPSMLIKDGHLYAVMDAGVAVCWDAATGAEKWKARLGGNFTASPVLVGERIYAFNEAGDAVIFRATPERFEKLAENQLADDAFATPTIVAGRIYARLGVREGDQRQEYLYCIGQ